MPQVFITIDGKQFRMACEEGQEPRLLDLAAYLEARIQSMRSSFGEIGDLRLAVMAGLTIVDEFFEASKSLEDLQTSPLAWEKETLVHKEDVRGGTAVSSADLALSSQAALPAYALEERDLELIELLDRMTARVERIAHSLQEEAETSPLSNINAY